MEKEQILKRVEKPGRYVGGEIGQTVKDKENIRARVAFCFPDTYEIGMSNLGVRILYHCLNLDEDVWCERVYAPWTDMESEMRKYHMPLCALESGDALDAFDFVAFTLQYELCYSNVLNMLELGNLPLLAKDRGEDCPIIIGGGPCAYNPEPMADFFDVFNIGEGENALREMTRLYINMKENKTYSRTAFLRKLSHLQGFYVPSLYEVSYGQGGTIFSFAPKYEDVPATITKCIIEDMDTVPFPTDYILPYIETVHDRIMLEVYRGCPRGCRFCQSGMISRPARSRSPQVLNRQAKELYESTGFSEISMCSLSISDYVGLHEMTDALLEWTDEKKVSLSLPSLRADSFTKELMDKISGVRSSTLTFAPEAGTQRLRDVINKNVTMEDVLHACNTAFAAGKSQVKLYFMMGHPTETMEDVLAIGDVGKEVIHAFYQNPESNRKRGITVTLSVASFIPKPFTPFQWEKQDTLETVKEKQLALKDSITDRKIKYHYHDASGARLEAVFARGDRRVGKAILRGHELGAKFDSWGEFFDYDRWMQAFADTNVDVDFYTTRGFGEDEILPWDMINIGVTKAFLLRERHKAQEEKTTQNCMQGCSGCGANHLGGGMTWCPKTNK